MTICCISDTHGYKPKNLPIADVLVHAGDFTASRIHYHDDALEFLRWFGAQPHRHKILVAGNHDFLPYHDKDSFYVNCVANGISYLQDSAVTIDNVKFYGSPWTPPFFDWAFMKTEAELAVVCGNIPQSTDVLITHGPPAGTLDLVSTGEYVGSRELTKAIKLLNIKAHIFGHIHGMNGVLTQDGVQYVNAAVMTENYKPTQPPHVITIGDLADVYIPQQEFY